MPNDELRLAQLSSLIYESVLLSEEKKEALLSKLKTMTDDQLDRLEVILGKEESIATHNKELTQEELFDSLTEPMLKEADAFFTWAEEELLDAKKAASEEEDKKMLEDLSRMLKE